MEVTLYRNLEWKTRKQTHTYSIFTYLPNRPQQYSFDPLSPNSDQHQFSPNNIDTLSRDKMISKEKLP